MASGLLGDTLSYIRLFAIGLTGSILGGVFNTLAVTMTDGSEYRGTCDLYVVDLVSGSLHQYRSLYDQLLGTPASFTIFVEYYKNAEFEGGGKAYEPFRKA